MQMSHVEESWKLKLRAALLAWCQARKTRREEMIWTSKWDGVHAKYSNFTDYPFNDMGPFNFSKEDHAIPGMITSLDDSELHFQLVRQEMEWRWWLVRKDSIEPEGGLFWVIDLQLRLEKFVARYISRRLQPNVLMLWRSSPICMKLSTVSC